MFKLAAGGKLADSSEIQTRQFGSLPQLQSAWDDISESWELRRLCWYLAKRDVVNRHRYSKFGAGWVILSQIIYSLGIGVVYGEIFRIDVKTFLPHVTVGLVVWSLISSLLAEASTTFTSNSVFLTQSRLPLTLFAVRSVVRNLILFAYRCTVVIAVLAIFKCYPTSDIFLVIPGLALVIIAGVCVSIIFGMLGARYRDVGPFISAIMPFTFLLTPIFWMPETLGRMKWITTINPFYHFLQIVRAPILNQPDLPLHFAVATCATLILFAAALWLMRNVGRRVIFWL